MHEFLNAIFELRDLASSNVKIGTLFFLLTVLISVLKGIG